MKIRTKLILNYSYLSVILLLSFSVIIVFLYVKYRQNNFETRLHNRAASSANLVLNKVAIDSSMISLFDKNIVTAMENVQIEIYNHDKDLIYTNITDQVSPISVKTIDSPLSWLNKGFVRISFPYVRQGETYEIVASAYDNYGLKELRNLLNIIGYVLGFSIIVIISIGFYNAMWSLKPFKKMIKELDLINPSNIKKRIPAQGNDEISHLARAFNTLLDRIERAFETEQSFISNASHELRTPVTSIMGQIEVALNKSRDEQEYKSILMSVYEDTFKMATIINGFLELAQTNMNLDNIEMPLVRIDELIFGVIDEFKRKKPQYNVSVEFKSSPEIQSQLECNANARLLDLMFSNLIDNACKYSTNNKARVILDFDKLASTVSIIDHGIGIPEIDMENIFKPLYRASNASTRTGHGLGLAIVKKIADLHNAEIHVQSTENMGTVVSVIIKNKAYNNHSSPNQSP